MKKKYLKYYEFEEYYMDFNPDVVIFDTLLQDWEYSPLRFYLTFSTMRFSYAPDTIFLRGSSGDIALQCVEKIRVDVTGENISEITIICGTSTPKVKNKFKIVFKKT